VDWDLQSVEQERTENVASILCLLEKTSGRGGRESRVFKKRKHWGVILGWGDGKARVKKGGSEGLNG